MIHFTFFFMFKLFFNIPLCALEILQFVFIFHEFLKNILNNLADKRFPQNQQQFHISKKEALSLENC